MRPTFESLRGLASERPPCPQVSEEVPVSWMKFHFDTSGELKRTDAAKRGRPQSEAKELAQNNFPISSRSFNCKPKASAQAVRSLGPVSPLRARLWLAVKRGSCFEPVPKGQSKATKGNSMNAMLESTLKWPLRDLVGTFDDDVRTADWKRHRFIDRFELYARSSRLTRQPCFGF